jgi:putative addiction module killer protein
MAQQYSIEYTVAMYTIQRTEAFSVWLAGLKDSMTRARLVRRLERAQQGNLGDVKPVGGGVYEMREFFGPGWRMYYVQRGAVLLVMLGGGGKSTQQGDIAAAQALAATLEE